jgi:hypothetical protein
VLPFAHFVKVDISSQTEAASQMFVPSPIAHFATLKAAV